MERAGRRSGGFVILIAARGNYNRASFFNDYESVLTRYAVRFFNCLNMLKDHALPLLFFFAAAFALLCFSAAPPVSRRCSGR